jgi:hypothetical protein
MKGPKDDKAGTSGFLLIFSWSLGSLETVLKRKRCDSTILEISKRVHCCNNTGNHP